MNIQINSDNNITTNETFTEFAKTTISEKLKRFDDHITRVEVHFNDENGQKTGGNDIRCLLEARIEGRQPVAVTDHADSKETALKGAIHKLVNSLDTIVDKLKSH